MAQTSNFTPDVEAAVERIKQTSERVLALSKENGLVWLEAYEKMLNGVLKLEEDTAKELGPDWVETLVSTQADLMRETSQAYLGAVKDRLEVVPARRPTESGGAGIGRQPDYPKTPQSRCGRRRFRRRQRQQSSGEVRRRRDADRPDEPSSFPAVALSGRHRHPARGLDCACAATRCAETKEHQRRARRSRGYRPGGANRLRRSRRTEHE